MLQNYLFSSLQFTVHDNCLEENTHIKQHIHIISTTDFKTGRPLLLEVK